MRLKLEIRESLDEVKVNAPELISNFHRLIERFWLVGTNVNCFL